MVMEFATGLFSGFFGISGGFLIVLGLVGSTGMPMLNAVGMLGSIFGAKIAKRLSRATGRLTRVFAAIIFLVASYMLINTVERI